MKLIMMGEETPSGKRGDDTTDGTVRTVARVSRLLRVLAASGRDGARLTDVARSLDLTKPTVHRLLGALVAAGLAGHDAATRRYRLGELSWMLGEASSRLNIASGAHEILERLADLTEDTVYVSVREGVAAVCVGKAVGGFPIRTLTLEVGDLRPLGVGAGSLALLACLPDDEIDATLKRNRVWLRRYPRLSAEVLLEEVRATRSQGYALNRDGVISGMSAVGVAATDAQGLPLASFSIAAISDRLREPRLSELIALLRTEAQRFAERYQAPPGQSAPAQPPGHVRKDS